MTSFDYIILFLLAISLTVGYNKGLLKQLGIFCATFAGIIIGRVFARPLARFIIDAEYLDASDGWLQLLNKESILVIIVAIILFIVTFIATKILVGYLQVALETWHLGFLNRIGGMIFTTFLIFLMFSIILNVLQLAKSDGPIVPYKGIFNGKEVTFIMGFAPATFGVATSWYQEVTEKSSSATLIDSQKEK